MVEFYDETVRIRHIIISDTLKDNLNIDYYLDFSKETLPKEIDNLLSEDAIEEYKEVIELSLDSFNNKEVDLIRFGERDII